jgi:hypothetical protein
VAIVQISRITQRKGLLVDLPQPLAGAELGWAVDQRRLFIGNGELAEGAPVVGNTEILTEFSDILGFTTAYTYEGAAAGYIVQTGPTATPITQSLQQRLDSYAVVTDFGALGDGVTDDTAAINRALFELYCRQVNTQIRRSLFFPAGTYRITDTILVPPYCTIYGEGPESSIISLQVQAWSSTVGYQSGVLVENSGSYYRSLLEVPAGTALSNATFWASGQALPSYIARTVDSQQQEGVNIGTNGATPPTAITVTDMKFDTDQIIDGVLVEKCTNSTFSNVDIGGPLTTTELISNADNIAAVRWSSSTSLVCTNVRFKNCGFSGMTYGSATAQQTKGCVLSECNFDTLYQGAYIGGPVLTNGGPTGTRVVHSVFDNIYAEGIVIEGAQLNASGYNVFYDVGNHFNGVSLPATSIIDIDTAQNVSIGDMFQRTAANSTTYPRINLNFTASIGYDSADKIQQGTYTRFTGVRTTLVNNTATTAVFTVDAADTRAFKVDYTITRSTSTRAGTVSVVASTDGTGGNLTYIDDFIENTDPGVTLSVSETGSVVSFEYATTNTGVDAEFYYSITRFA